MKVITSVLALAMVACRRLLLGLGLLLLCAPRVIHAQTDSQWGIIASVTPRWRAPVPIEKTLKFDPYRQLFNGDVYIEAADFSLGIAHGRSPGGDWGIGFVRHTVEDDSLVEDVEYSCGFLNVESGCLRDGTSLRTRGVIINGVLFHKFVPFVTVKQRVQFGGVVGGGVGWFDGNAERHDLKPIVLFTDNRAGVYTGVQGDTTTLVPAEELGRYSMLPLMNLQLAAAVVVAPGLKIRGAWGLEFPGYSKVSLTGIYYFGGRRNPGSG